MKLITVVTCEDNVPQVNVFFDEAAMDDALTSHYAEVWQTNDADGDTPATWQDMLAQMQEQDCIRDRDIAHIQHHAVMVKSGPIVSP